MKRLAILGASGHGRVVADAAELAGWREVCFFDDAVPKNKTHGPWPVLGTTDELLTQVASWDGVVVAIGNNEIRLAKMEQLQVAGAPLSSIIHPSAVVSRYVQLGKGCVVFAGACINAGAVLGDGVIINTACSIDHDCQLGAGVHVSPGAHLAGGVRVGRASWIGIGAVVRQQISIGSGVVVGAGAAVVDDLPDDLCAVGVPARGLRTLSK